MDPINISRLGHVRQTENLEWAARQNEHAHHRQWRLGSLLARMRRQLTEQNDKWAEEACADYNERIKRIQS
jgi:hypothetical protein